MTNRYKRQLHLLGDDSPALLAGKTVMICGLGGVGGNILEGLVRAGIGTIILVDKDIFDESNLNRQLLCTSSTIGKRKTEVARQRAVEINPDILCIELPLFLSPENIPKLLEQYKPDYIADAIDNVTAKVHLAKCAEEMGIPIIASMGTGNKLDPTAFECADIYQTSVCPLAKVMRKLLKENRVNRLKVIYSKEPPKGNGKEVGSVSFVPAVAGTIIAGEIIKDLCNIRN